MAISSTVRKSGPYNGNGLTTVFPFGFKVLTSADLQVVRSGTDGSDPETLILGTDYAVTLNSNQDSSPGGSITTAVALASGKTLMITSALAQLQPTVLTNSGGFYPDVLNDSLDRLTILTQQLKERGDRAIVAPITENGGASMPSRAARANKVAYFDADGNLAGLVDSSAYQAAFDAVISGTQPLLTLIGNLGAQTFAQAVAQIADNADLFNFGRFGIDLAFSVAAGGPSYRISGDQRVVVTDLAAFQFTRGSATTGLNADGSLVTHTGDAPVITDQGIFFGRGGANKCAFYVDTPIGLLGVDLIGDDSARLSLVDDTAALTAAKLQGLVPSGKVIKIDNSLGTTSAWAAFRLASDLVVGDNYRYNIFGRCHAAGMYVRGGIEDLPGNPNAETNPNSSLTYVSLSNTVQAGGTESRVYGKASDHSIVYLTLPYLGEGQLNPTVPIRQLSPGTFTGIPSANLAQTVLDPIVATPPANLTKSGDAASTLTVVDDNADTTIQSMVPTKATAKVYQLDNTAGTAAATATATCSATVATTVYQVYSFVRVLNPGTNKYATVRLGGSDVATHGDPHWNWIGGSKAAGSTSDKIDITAQPGTNVQFAQLTVQAGATLPAALAPWAQADTPTVLDDQLTIPMPESYGNFFVEWGGGMQTLVEAPAPSTLDLGSTGERAWVGSYVSKMRSLRASESLNVYTPPAALPAWAYTRAYIGETYDPTTDPEFPTLAFSDDFSGYSLADTDTGVPSSSIKWFGEGHTTFGFADFMKPSQAPHDTYTIDAGKLRIRMQQIDGVWTTGCLSSINDDGEGFTFTKGYAEARMLVPMVAGAWGAFWATNELPGLLQPHAEVDFVELYGTNPENLHATLHIWPSGYPNPSGPSSHKQTGHAPKITALDGNYHTYGCRITDEWIIHYIDRVEWGRAPYYGECRLAPFKLLLNLAGLSTEVGSAVGPIDMYVDYVKVWTP